MTIKFHIHYHTQWGQKIMLTGSSPALGAWDPAKAVNLFPYGDGKWEHILEINPTSDDEIAYKYFLLDEQSGVRFFEWGENRVVTLTDPQKDYHFYDNWRPTIKDDNALYTSAFTQAIFRRENDNVAEKATRIAKTKTELRFQMQASRVEAQHQLCIVGSAKALGEWNFDKAVPLSAADFPNWTLSVGIAANELPLSYKYCIRDSQTGQILLDEATDRYFEPAEKAGVYVIQEEDFNYPRLPWKGTGVAIPVFSLRSQEGMGVGEFLDLKLLVDWAKLTGLKMIQILPVNDTVALHNWVDSYPYAAISVFALHPIYLRLQAIGEISSQITNEIIAERQNVLNAKTQVDYEAVMRVKARFIKLIFDEKKDEFLQSEEFETFYQANRQWLRPYAAFSYLRDLFGTPKFETWGRFACFTDELLSELTDSNSTHYDDIAIHYYQQYHLHIQLLEASEYARQNNILLKGDIPIGIYRNSVDAWVAPHLYNMNSQAGAPPDDFTDQGQNWRFPTYNWNEMAKDGFNWWKERLRKMESYFDAYRIDHILGFFRIWEIPGTQRQGLMGSFNPAWALHHDEIRNRGIHFDHHRMCTPYIREHMLFPLFFDLTDHVRSTYLLEYQHGCFYLRPEFDTQAKVEAHFELGPEASTEEKNRVERLKNGLYYLISEVLFFEAPFSNGQAFHPRHSMQKTWSFQELDPYTRQQLSELYNEYFYKRNNDFWREQALIKLPAIKNATDMLICGEDLGMVPDSVPSVMRELGILSLEVQRMPKDTKIEFGHPANYPYLSVATPSSHDTSTIRGWWEEDSTRAQRFYSQILGQWGSSPFFCEPEIVRQVINQHLYSPSMWAVFPIQDLLGLDANLRLPDARAERINEPANSTHYWRYRLHISLEDLIAQTEFNQTLLQLQKQSGRYNSY